MLYIIT